MIVCTEAVIDGVGTGATLAMGLALGATETTAGGEPRTRSPIFNPRKIMPPRRTTNAAINAIVFPELRGGGTGADGRMAAGGADGVAGGGATTSAGES